MSETEHIAGRLIPVVHKSTSLAGAMREILEHHGEYDPDEGLVEQFEDFAYRQYVVYGGIIYHVVGAEVDEEVEIANAIINKDGTIEFEVQWYNGGASFDEIVEKALSKATRRE